MVSLLPTFSSVHYYFKRAREAPIRITVQKIWLRLKPYAFLPNYARMAHGRARSSAVLVEGERSVAIALGRSIAERLRVSCVLDALAEPRARARAQDALGGRTSCLGYGSISIPVDDKWSSDGFHDHQWPTAYFPNVDYLTQGIHCDVKVPWELSRLQYLVWLAEGAVHDPANSARYRDQYVSILRNWLSNNPPGFGVNWVCPMEVGVRAINMLVSYSIFAEALDSATAESIEWSLREHALFIERFPEVSDVPGNHYLADLAGHVFPLVLTRGNDSHPFRKAIRAFAEEAERQFEPGGCHLERAPVYHRLCLDMVALVLAIAIRHQCPDRERLESILWRGLNFCRAIGTRGAKLPIFGDCDSGHILFFGTDARNFVGLEQFALRLRGQSAGLNNDLAHWLCALADISTEAALVETDTRRSVETDDRSGFLSARSGDLVVVMRVGEQGLLGRAPHDHDDALSVWLTKGERDIVVEEGCHSYTLNPETRARYIGSRAHNVVQPALRDRYGGVPGSIFKTVRGAPTASSWSHEVEEGAARLSANLAAPNRTGQPFEFCRRTVSIPSPNKAQFDDEWSLRAVDATDLSWHFAPGLQVGIKAREAELRDDQGNLVARLAIESHAPVTLSKFSYEYSPVYGFATTCEGVTVSIPAQRSCLVRSTFEMVEALPSGK